MNTPPFKCLFDNDTTNIVRAAKPEYYDPKTMTPESFESGGEFTDAMIEASIDETVGTGVDVHKLSPGHSWVAWWKSASAPAEAHYRWFEQTYGKPPDAYGRYMLAGGDMVATFVRHCRKVGQAPFLSLRLNQVQAIKDKARQLNWSRWMEEHYPDYCLNEPDTTAKEQRRLNWMLPDVRRHFLTFAAEWCAYDIDGFEIDFTRHASLFRQDQTTRLQREDTVTAFVADIRRLLDRHAREGRRRWLCIKVPCHLAEYPMTGLDLERLVAEAGVDMVNVFPSFFTQQQTDLHRIRAMLPAHVGVYLEMSDCTDSTPPYGKRRTTDAQFYTAAHLAYARGAAGVSLFNFVYYRQWDGYGHQGTGGRIVQPVPFHVLRHLHDADWLAQQSQHWFLSRGYGGYDPGMLGSGKMMMNARENPQSPFPVILEPGQRVGCTLDMAPSADGWRQAGRCRIQARASLARTTLGLCLNGAALEPTPDVSEPFAHPYRYRDPSPLGQPEDYQAWTVPAELLKDGENVFEISMKEGESAELCYLDIVMKQD